jgi:hypothetical protein
MKWSEQQYSWTYAQLPVGELAAGWSSNQKKSGPGYEASAFGRRLKDRFSSIEEAQDAAEKAAMQSLKLSIALLEDRG